MRATMVLNVWLMSFKPATLEIFTDRDKGLTVFYNFVCTIRQVNKSVLCKFFPSFTALFFTVRFSILTLVEFTFFVSKRFISHHLINYFWFNKILLYLNCYYAKWSCSNFNCNGVKKYLNFLRRWSRLLIFFEGFLIQTFGLRDGTADTGQIFMAGFIYAATWWCGPLIS